MIVNTIFNQTESYFSLRVLLKEMSFDSRATDDLTLLNDLLNLGQVLFWEIEAPLKLEFTAIFLRQNFQTFKTYLFSKAMN